MRAGPRGCSRSSRDRTPTRPGAPGATSRATRPHRHRWPCSRKGSWCTCSSGRTSRDGRPKTSRRISRRRSTGTAASAGGSWRWWRSVEGRGGPPQPPPASTNLHNLHRPPLEHPLPPHPHVHHVLHPGPERILPLHRHAIRHVAPPPLHDLRVLSPETHALARDAALPQLGNGRVGVQQAHGHIARQEFERAQVHAFVAIIEGHAAGAREVRLAVGEQHDVERRQDQVVAPHVQGGALEERVEVGDRVFLGEPRPQVRRDLRGRFAGEILDRVEHLGLARTLAAELPDEDRRIPLQPPDAVQVRVDVERRELDRSVETGVVTERAADVQADHERRPGRPSLLRRRARHDAERQRECRDATPHDAPPSTVWVLPVAKIGVLWSTWSSDRNGRLKCGLPMMTTTKKLNPLATSCSTGRVSSSIRCCASFLNHSCSALSALIGPRQNSASTVAPARTAPRPSIAFRPRMARSAGVPNRPNRNHVMPRTPTHPRSANPSVPTTPSWIPCWASHGVIASISSRYRNSTSNRATVISTSTIATICPTARVLIASFNTWMHAKLPPMMMNRKNHRITTRARAFTW